jgi:4,4'-diaponeurosporenoate glycosyltransferase
MPYIVFFFWLLGFVFLWKIPSPKKIKDWRPHEVRLSVIIPARNEEKNLAELLQSMEHQIHKPGEVIVVDDHSEDATADVGKRFGCKVIRSKELPQGWIGKPWACWQGAHSAVNDILLFLDADTCLEPDGLSKLLSSFFENEGLLTVQPYHALIKNYERLSAIFNIIVLAGINAFTPLRSKLKPEGAFGPCMMCRKDHYFEVGGHEIAKNDILESMSLGKAFIEAGHGVHCYGGKKTISFRMYPEGFRSLVEGFSKGFGIGANAISLTVLMMIVCWVFGGVSLTRHLIQSILAGNLNDIITWMGLDLLYVVQIHWMLVRIGNFGIRTAILFQIPLLFFVLVFALSILKTFILKKARWKGRVVNTEDRGKKSSCD